MGDTLMDRINREVPAYLNPLNLFQGVKRGMEAYQEKERKGREERKEDIIEGSARIILMGKYIEGRDLKLDRALKYLQENREILDKLGRKLKKEG